MTVTIVTPYAHRTTRTKNKRLRKRILTATHNIEGTEAPRSFNLLSGAVP